MNFTKTIMRFSFFALAAFALASCEKTFDDKISEQEDLSNNSIVQVYVAALNVNRNHVWVDAQRVTGAALVSGGLFPANGYGAAVKGGLRAFLVRDTLVSSVQPILSFGENMQVARHHTIFLFDTVTAIKQKTVVDDIVDLPLGTSRIRFAHFSYLPNQQVPAIDVYSQRLQQVIFSNVPYTGVTDYVNIPSGVTDTLTLRVAGSGTNLQNVTGSTWNDIRLIFTPTNKRHYTAVFRGGFATTLTTNAHVRQFSLFANY